MIAVCRESLDYLQATWSEEEALFPYSTEVVDGAYVNTYRPLAGSIRYTITALVGLAAMRAGEPDHPCAPWVDDVIETFLRRHLREIDDAADLGLLLVLVAGVPGRRESAYGLLDRVVERLSSRGLTMQDLAWMLWGLCAAHRAGLVGAAAPARRLNDLIHRDYVDAESGMPRHNRTRYRRAMVSFGGLVYYLRSVAEFAATFDDERAAKRFETTVRRVLELQGPLGEWPWMIDVRRGITLDRYPVFGVHQDSMAMLFLLPARDRGMNVTDAIVRSYRWIDGANDLGLTMSEREPFVLYRAIERNAPLPRLSRYVRALLVRMSGRPAGPVSARILRVNSECRSYHPGWLLYVWSGRPDAPLLTGDAEADAFLLESTVENVPV